MKWQTRQDRTSILLEVFPGFFDLGNQMAGPLITGHSLKLESSRFSQRAIFQTSCS